MTKNVLICGASIAGPALAHWLHRYGFTVTVVERAPELRPGGQAVDLRGVAKEAVCRMGLMDEVRAACTATRGMSVVDRDNRALLEMRSDMLGGDGLIAEIEILRGDLAAVLHRATESSVEYVFGDHVTGLSERADGVEVSLASGARRTFDLVVGADGLHSELRAMVFGPESAYLRDLGFLTAFYTVPNRLGLDAWMVSYAEPRYTAAVRAIHGNTEAMAFLALPGRRGDFDHRDPAQQKALLRRDLAGMAWEVPWLLERLDEAPDFYLDTCSQVSMERWSHGRVALLGDAAYCSSPISGQGTSLAMLGAYVLAGELAAAGGDHTVAFPAYERRMRPHVAATQAMGRDNARWFSANTWFALRLRNRLMRLTAFGPVAALVMRRMNKVINGLELPDYSHLLVESRG